MVNKNSISLHTDLLTS